MTYKQSVYAVCFAAALAACETGGPPASGKTNAGGAAAPAASDRSGTGVPTGGTEQPSGSGSTSGPHEGSRANTPPGISRDGQPPVGGAIIDPTGAVTGTPPPPGMR